MYFSGQIEIDPSQATMIKKVKTLSFFSKFLDVLTFGSVSPKQEQETFTAVSILQQIYMGLRTMKVHNIIRLSVDNYNFYFDESGKEDDLEDAIFQFTSKVDPLESELFSVIDLVMEHLQNSIKFLIEIKIKRKHKVGEYPILISVNGVLNDFELNHNDDPKSLKKKLSSIFINQETYDNFVFKHKLYFDQFVENLVQSIQKFVLVDNIKQSSSIHVIRPKQKIVNISQIRHDKFTRPVYYGYFNFDNFFLYSWFWAELLYQNNLYFHDAFIVDELGNEIMNIGEEGFHSAETNTLNPTADFETPNNGDVEYFTSNEYSSELESAGVLSEFPQEENSNADTDSSSVSDNQ